MRIGLIDVDGGKKFPNIPLMKISAWHKSRGDEVEWYTPWDERYDRVYMAKVFSFSENYDEVINADEVVCGGSGYAISIGPDGREVYNKDLDRDLPDEIEHMFPDYSLYPHLTVPKGGTAYGFLTRGCPRGCHFCIVAGKEGKCSHQVAELSEFWNGQKNIVLCDPNILACRNWKRLLEQLVETKCWVDFNQGLDIRMMTPEKADLLCKIKMREVHFAWDRYQDKKLVVPKLRMFSERPEFHKWSSGKHAVVYTLVNYDTTLEQDLERIYTLREMGYSAYVMIYEKETCDPIYKRLSRWCNDRHIYATCPNFKDYK